MCLGEFPAITVITVGVCVIVVRVLSHSLHAHDCDLSCWELIGTQIMFTDALLGSVKTDHALTYCKKLLCTRRACNFFKGIRRLSYFCIPVIIFMFVFPIILHLQDLQSAQFNSHLSTCSSVTFFWYFPGDPPKYIV